MSETPWRALLRVILFFVVFTGGVLLLLTERLSPIVFYGVPPRDPDIDPTSYGPFGGPPGRFGRMLEVVGVSALVALWVAYSLSVRRLDALKWPLALVGVLVGVLWLRRRLRIFG